MFGLPRSTSSEVASVTIEAEAERGSYRDLSQRHTSEQNESARPTIPERGIWCFLRIFEGVLHTNELPSGKAGHASAMYQATKVA